MHAGFVLPRIGEAKTYATSVKNRISKFRTNPELFQVLSDSVDRLGKQIKVVDSIVEKHPGAVPKDICALFNWTFQNVCSTLEGAISTMDKSLSKAFGPGGSSRIGSKMHKLKQFGRANEFHDELKALQSKIDISISLLHDLIGVLSTAVKAEENKAFFASKIGEVQSTLDEKQTIVAAKIDGVQSTLDEKQTIMAAKIDEVQSTLYCVAEKSQEVYTPEINAPAPSRTVRLDFGITSTPEGLLKRSVLYGESSEIVTAATGANGESSEIVHGGRRSYQGCVRGFLEWPE